MPKEANHKPLGIALALGAGLGVAIGAGIGVAMNDIAAWTPRGLIVGILFGVAVGMFLSK
jgi:F0F1-type ATP synthase assembly protein I